MTGGTTDPRGPAASLTALEPAAASERPGHGWPLSAADIDGVFEQRRVAPDLDLVRFRFAHCPDDPACGAGGLPAGAVRRQPVRRLLPGIGRWE
ncbi:hypothetical protein ACGFZQ_44090 [Streptomyces sp. NPDC048254]|uniref:hypothetical protein n=1 Tax=Streptomyces sp. NPDC048254 TaxID=3365525 RepID=UPI00372391BB